MGGETLASPEEAASAAIARSESKLCTGRTRTGVKKEGGEFGGAKSHLAWPIQSCALFLETFVLFMLMFSNLSRVRARAGE